MERELHSEDDRQAIVGGPSGGGPLDTIRDEIDGLLQATDQVFDAINSLQAQQYLQQNQQTGGQ